MMKSNRKYWLYGILILAVAAIIFISGCVTEKPEKYSLEEYLNNVKINPEYKVNHFSAYSSAGGTRGLTVSYTIQNNVAISCNGTYTAYMTDGKSTYDCDLQKLKNKEYNAPGFMTIKDIISNLQNIEIIGRFESENKSCFYGGLQLVCFTKDNQIINYMKTDGPSYLRWNIDGYDYNFKRSEFVADTKDLRFCSSDSDCTLTTSGVCDKDGNPVSISVSFDPGCRASINKKYSLFWQILPFVGDACIPSKCAGISKQYFVAACKNNLCEPTIVSK